MRTTPERWRQITEIFHQALERPLEHRDAFLREASGPDFALRSEVDSLIAAHEAAGSFGESPFDLAGSTLIPGAFVGPYRIEDMLGAGGMGQVYRARDERLGRSVAIKVLHSHIGSSRERLAAFEREARVLASLNHPHIAAIYGVEESADGPALVMELIEGEDLADRLARGPIDVAEALAIARQIAEALEAAHEQAIVHRDLKPGNVRIRQDGTAKVLDLGLAALLGNSGSPPPADAASGSHQGTIAGTASYMSPEQARGKALGKRTDVWAFGCVLYEMLTGRAAFVGDSTDLTMAEVLQHEPDWTLLPAATAPSIRTLLKRCLEKDEKRRLDSAAALRLEIDDALAPGNHETRARAPSARRFVPVLMAVAASTVLSVLVMWWLRPSVAPLAPARFAIVAPPARPLNISGGTRDLAIAPDGRHLVYRAGGTHSTGSPLMVRAIDQLDPHPILGVSFAYAPFISPDSRWIAFFEKGDIKKVAIDGGPVVTLAAFTGEPLGASWGDNDAIIFATDDPASGLWRLPAEGGSPTMLTTPNADRGEADHAFPSALPHGQGVLFTIVAAGGLDDTQIAVLDLATGRTKALLRGSQAEYVQQVGGSDEAGYVIYTAAGELRAVRFNPASLDVIGEPLTLGEHVMMKPTGAANYGVSRLGTLAYIPEGTRPDSTKPRSLVWVDRNGREEPLAAPVRAYGIPRISPDGTRAAFDVTEANNVDIFIWQFAQKALSRLTFDPAVDSMPVWTPDSKQIVFMSKRSGVFNLYRQAADGSGPVVRVTISATSQWPISMSRDGRRVVAFDRIGSFVGLLAAPASRSTHAEVPGQDGLGDAAVENRFEGTFAEISPNGHYVTYQLSEAGRTEVYVRSFPNVREGRWQVTTRGATRPVWAPSGDELFYLDESLALTSVPVSTTGTTFRMGVPARVFETRYPQPNPSRHYDVSPDSRRFLMLKDELPVDSYATPVSVVIVQAWFDQWQRMARGR